MRKNNTCCIARLLGGLLLVAGLVTGACTNETDRDGRAPDGGNPASTERRAVLITLKNKLALLPQGAGGAGTRGIATTAENAIASLDVYAFGADQEDGTYTYMSRFAYRADGSAIPQGAAELQLNTDAEGTGTTSGLISLRKGLFVKLYCVANDLLLTDPVDESVQDVADFVPITYNDPAAGGNPIAQAGTPTLNQFLTYRTRLLAADVPADTLATPLAMSGAYITPLDLTDTETVTRLQVAFQLTRLAARFDVENKAVDSRFTIQSIGMGKGRRAVSYFPIRPQGSQPAEAGELITCPVRSFTGATANTGMVTGAFYSYPSPSADAGYLILKGLYKINETEQQEVSYQVPFRQTTPDGRETYLEINNNHRYIVSISKADPKHLDVNFTVADWADDGSIDYEPENKPGEATVIIPEEFVGETTDVLDPDRNIHTLSMSLREGSSFDVQIGATSGLTVSKTYAGGASGQKYDWLDIATIPTTRMATVVHTYHFTPKEGYLLGRFPRATVRIADAFSGTETILYVGALAVPAPEETVQPDKAPNGTSANPNSFDPETLTASLYRITGSYARASITCLDGIDIVSKPDWLDVAVESQKESTTTYSFTLNDREVVDTEGIVVFGNKKNTGLKTDVKILLLDAAVKTDFALVTGDNSYTAPTEDVLGNITMKLKEVNSAIVKTSALDGVTVKIDFESGSSVWLKSNGDPTPTTRAAAPTTRAAAPATRAASKREQDITFSLIADQLAGAGKATVTLTNKVGGVNDSFTLTPSFDLGKLTLVSATPTNSKLVDHTFTFYKIATASTMKLKVVSYGGSVVELGDSPYVTVTQASSRSSVTQDLNEAYYTLTANAVGTASLMHANRTDFSKMETYTVNVLEGEISVSSSIDVTAANSGSTTIPATTPIGVNTTVSVVNWGGGDPWFTLNTPSLTGGSQNIQITQGNNVGNIMKPATLRLTNPIAGGANKEITVTPILAAPSFNNGTSLTLQNATNDNSTFGTFTVTTPPGGYEFTGIANGTIVSETHNGDSYTVTAKLHGTTTLNFRNKSDNSKTSTYTVTVARDYEGAAVWKFGGYYIAKVDATTKVDWYNTGRHCSNKSGASWRVPSYDEWKKITDPATYGELKNKNIFSIPSDYWSRDEQSGDSGMACEFKTDKADNTGELKGNQYRVRCITN